MSVKKAYNRGLVVVVVTEKGDNRDDDLTLFDLVDNPIGLAESLREGRADLVA